MKYYPDSNPDEFKSIPRSYIGLVGRATYDWKTRYMVEMNVGYNGSENFAPGKRFGLFPAVSAGWVLTEENFMQPLKPWLSYFKLRASYGVVGNDRVSVTIVFFICRILIIRRQVVIILEIPYLQHGRVQWKVRLVIPT